MVIIEKWPNGAITISGEGIVNDETIKAMQKAGYHLGEDPCAAYATGLPFCEQEEVRKALRVAAKRGS